MPVKDHGSINQTVSDLVSAVNGEAGTGIANAALPANVAVGSLTVSSGSGPYVPDATLPAGGMAAVIAKITGLTGATAASRRVGATTSGAPLSGTFAVGDFLIAQDGKLWICTVAGTPGTWKAAGSSIVGLFNPMDYGAKFDGTTDDTTALIAACNAAIAYPLGTVLLPTGTTVLNAKLPDIGQPNYNLIGAGIGATIIKLGAAFDWTTVPGGQGILRVHGDKQLIGGFMIDATLSTTGSIGSTRAALYCQGGQQNEYFDLWIKNVGVIQADNGYGMIVDSANACKFKNVIIAGNYKGAKLQGVGSGGQLGCTFEVCYWGNSTHGLNLELLDASGAVGCTDNTFLGCTVDEISGGETAAAAITGANATRNTFIGGRYTSGAGGGTQDAFDIRAGTKTRFVGAYIGPWTTGLTTASGLSVAAGSDVTLSGCDLRNSATQGGSGGNGLINAGIVYDDGGNTIDAYTGAGSYVSGAGPSLGFIYGTQVPTETVLVSGVNANLGELVGPITITAARVVGAPIAPFKGQHLRFNFIQGGIGGFAITWNAVFKKTWSDAGNVTGARTSISFYYDGTNWNQESAQAPYV